MMKGLTVWLAVAFAAGILTAIHFRGSLFISSLLLLFLTPFLWSARGREIFLPLSFIAFILLGSLSFQTASHRPSNAVESWAGSRRIYLEGTVETQPEIKTRGKKVTVSFILSSRNLRRSVDGRKEFFRTHGNVQVFLFQPPQIPQAGNVVRLSGRLEKPKPVLNPGGFDYGRYLAERNIYALFQGFGPYAIRVTEDRQKSFFLRNLFRVRLWIARKLDRQFVPGYAGLLKALILGSRSGLSPEWREAFIKTGTAHLLAISGLNITLVAGSFYFALIAFRISQKIAAALSLIVVSAYVVVAGLGLPVERAGIMATVFFAAILLEREHYFLNSFFLAFLTLLLINPQSLTSISFQLSFLSVFSLVFLMPASFEKWRLKDTLGRGVAVMAGTFPFIIYYFNIFSPIGLLANVIAIPLFDLSLLLAFLTLALGDIPFADFILVKGTSLFLQGGMAWIEWLAKARWGYFFLSSPSIAQMVIYYFLLILLFGLKFFPKRFPVWGRSILVGLWLLAASACFWPQPHPAFSLTLFSAGKNELAHFQFASGGDWLMNTGRAFPSEQAQWIISPYLRHHGVNHLAGILVTDTNLKHTGGLKHLLNNFSPDYYLYPQMKRKNKMEPQSRNDQLNRVLLKGGEKIPIGKEGAIHILAIIKEQAILGIAYKNWHFLFLPDLTPEILEALKSRRDFIYKTDVLILPSLKRNSFLAELEELFDLSDPKIVSLPHSNDQLKQFLIDRDIDLLDLSSRGAATFAVEGPQFSPFQASGTPFDDSLKIRFFLNNASVS